MKRDLILTGPIASSFLSCEKDTEIILRKLFIESRPHSDVLRRLLVVQNKDAMDNTDYDMSAYNLKKLIDEKYIVLSPKIEVPEHDQVKSFITLNFDNFVPNATNPQFRDCMINIDVACHHDYWDLGNYRQRPFKIMGYVDGILNKSRLTGIGQLHFAGGSMTGFLNDDWSFYTISYLATHGSDDQIESPDEE